MLYNFVRFLCFFNPSKNDYCQIVHWSIYHQSTKVFITNVTFNIVQLQNLLNSLVGRLRPGKLHKRDPLVVVPMV